MCFRPTEVSVADQPCICPACNNENAPGESVCIFCGADLNQNKPNPPVASPTIPVVQPTSAAPSSPKSTRQ